MLHLGRVCFAWVAVAAIGLLANGASTPAQAMGLRASPPAQADTQSPPAQADTQSLVLPGVDIPGDWELVDQRSLKAGEQQLNLYHELKPDPPGRIVGLGVARFDDAAAATASLGTVVSQARDAGRPGSPVDNLGDEPGVAFIYQIIEPQVRGRFGFDQDALGETVLIRVDRYLLTVQVGGPSSMLPDVDALALELSQRQVSYVRDALASAGP
jgi:hypothetical protein